MTTDTQPASNTLSKKDLRKGVYNKLERALSEYRGQMKEKRLEAFLKKASRTIANQLCKGVKKKKDKKKKKEKLTVDIKQAGVGTA